MPTPRACPLTDRRRWFIDRDDAKRDEREARFARQAREAAEELQAMDPPLATAHEHLDWLSSGGRMGEPMGRR